MTDDQLRVILLALLPKDGTPRTVTWLSDMAYVWKQQVREALKAPLEAGQVQYDLLRDSYAAVREQAS